jgi:hypothetical protein
VRKTAAIFLLLILSFNIIGYRAWFYFAEKKSDRQMEALLDKDQYSERDLVTLTIPLNMPYQLDRDQFERTDGEVIINGQLLKYVKRKVIDGNLILLCMPDANKMELKKAKTEFGNSVNGLASSSTNKKLPTASTKTTPFGEYEQASDPIGIHTLSLFVPNRADRSFAALPETLIAFPGKPPENHA